MAAEASIKGAWVINAALILGCVWTGMNTTRETQRLTGRIDRKARDLETLYTLEQERSGFAGYVNAFERLPERTPPDLEGFVAQAVPGTTPVIRALPGAEVGHGWRTRRMEVRFDEVDLGALGGLLGAAAGRQPAWRLADWSITAAAARPGHGAARLVFEALAKGEGP